MTDQNVDYKAPTADNLGSCQIVYILVHPQCGFVYLDAVAFYFTSDLLKNMIKK